MGDEQQDPFKDLPEEVYAFFGASYIHQNQLSWGRTQLLVAVEAGTLAAAFASRSPLAVVPLLFGVFLMIAIWRLVERHWEIRDDHLKLLDKVHQPLDIRVTKEPRNRWWSGSFILRVIFRILIGINILLSILFISASFCDCKALDVFRAGVGS